MPARKSTSSKTPSAKTARKPRAAAKAHAAPDALARLRKPLKEVIAEARETSHEYALASLGIASRMQKYREARMAEWVAEGKRVEPKVKQAVEQWKEKFQSKVDVKKLELPKLNLDVAAIRDRIEEFRANSRRRFGLSAH